MRLRAASQPRWATISRMCSGGVTARRRPVDDGGRGSRCGRRGSSAAALRQLCNLACHRMRMPSIAVLDQRSKPTMARQVGSSAPVRKRTSRGRDGVGVEHRRQPQGTIVQSSTIPVRPASPAAAGPHCMMSPSIRRLWSSGPCRSGQAQSRTSGRSSPVRQTYTRCAASASRSASSARSPRAPSRGAARRAACARWNRSSRFSTHMSKGVVVVPSSMKPWTWKLAWFVRL